MNGLICRLFQGKKQINKHLGFDNILLSFTKTAF